jgi:hypothetical protein
VIPGGGFLFSFPVQGAVMKTLHSPTVVVFRYWDKEIIALFPEIASDQEGNCESFMHIGQHGGADYDGIIKRSRPARPAEYSSLFWELQSEPYCYNLEIRQRATPQMRTKRLQDAKT